MGELEVNTVGELRGLKPDDIGNIIVPEKEILKWFDFFDAQWVHSGNPEDPHAELTTGLCSNAFFDCLRILKDVKVSKILAHQLALKLVQEVGTAILGNVKWVIGSPMAAITFAHDVANAIGAPTNMFVEKNPENQKRMLWKRMSIPKGESVLQIEELITTSHTVNEVRRAIEDGNSNPVNFSPFIGVLVHRPPKMVNSYEGRKVVALIEKEVWAKDPSECNLCKAGSKRYKPKTHWEELTGKK